MGIRVECPGCGHEFHVHGFEDVATCFECSTLFNPKREKVDA